MLHETNNKPIYLTLSLLILVMGSFIVVNLFSNFFGFLKYMGFAAGELGTIEGWMLAAVVVVGYCKSACNLSDVKDYMFKFDKLKAVAILAALCAGIVEEIIFRKWIIDYLAEQEYSIFSQIFISGLAFGLAHLLWGIKNIKAGLNAALSTFLLGLALAIVYVISDRSLAPCILAHFLISALIEPGLLISANKDKLGVWSEVSETSSK